MLDIVLVDTSQQWFETILERWKPEAEQKVRELLAEAELREDGCMVTPTLQPRKVRFRGGQTRAYRFVLAVLETHAPRRDEVVRHLCNNRRCINPAHLEFGDAAENWEDELARRALGDDRHQLWR